MTTHTQSSLFSSPPRERSRSKRAKRANALHPIAAILRFVFIVAPLRIIGLVLGQPATKKHSRSKKKAAMRTRILYRFAALSGFIIMLPFRVLAYALTSTATPNRKRSKKKAATASNNLSRIAIVSRNILIIPLYRAVKYLLWLIFNRSHNMTTSTSRRPRTSAKSQSYPLLMRYLPVWAVVAGVALLVVLPPIVTFARTTLNRIPRMFAGSSPLAPLFTDEVEYWADDIVRWAQAYDLDPNLLATVMQIESCGHPTVASYAGAQGLFQVMPFHFDTGENQLDPDTNAKRGADFLRQCLDWADGNTGMAMACYNGGPSVLQKDFLNWSSQTRRYYIWGSGIYRDAETYSSSSNILNEWLDAGGKGLCNMASAQLGLS